MLTKHRAVLKDSGTPVARRVRRATGLHRSSPRLPKELKARADRVSLNRGDRGLRHAAGCRAELRGARGDARPRPPRRAADVVDSTYKHRRRSGGRSARLHPPPAVRLAKRFLLSWSGDPSPENRRHQEDHQHLDEAGSHSRYSRDPPTRARKIEYVRPPRHSQETAGTQGTSRWVDFTLLDG